MEKAKDIKTGAKSHSSAMQAVSPDAAKAWMACLSEITDFLTQRVKQDLDTQKAMMACQNPAEMLKVQADFLVTAMEQYTGCSQRLLTSLSATNPLHYLGSAKARRYDDVPL